MCSNLYLFYVFLVFKMFELILNINKFSAKKVVLKVNEFDGNRSEISGK